MIWVVLNFSLMSFHLLVVIEPDSHTDTHQVGCNPNPGLVVQSFHEILEVLIEKQSPCSEVVVVTCVESKREVTDQERAEDDGADAVRSIVESKDPGEDKEHLHIICQVPSLDETIGLSGRGVEVIDVENNSPSILFTFINVRLYDLLTEWPRGERVDYICTEIENHCQ